MKKSEVQPAVVHASALEELAGRVAEKLASLEMLKAKICESLVHGYYFSVASVASIVRAETMAWPPLSRSNCTVTAPASSTFSGNTRRSPG